MNQFSKTHLLNYFIIICFIFLVTGCGGGCRNMVQGKAVAEKAIQKFHNNYNKLKFKEIYETSNDEFRGNTSYQDFEKFIVAVHNKLGQAKSTNAAGWQVKSYNLKTFVIIQQETRYEQGKGTETFTFVIDNGKAILHGYKIDSMDLVLK